MSYVAFGIYQNCIAILSCLLIEYTGLYSEDFIPRIYTEGMIDATIGAPSSISE